MPNDWREEIGKLLGEVLERPPGERDAFLRERCADAAVRDEVASLVAACEAAPAFFERIAEAGVALVLSGWNEAGEMTDDWISDPLNLEGERIGRYAVEAHLGGGGMGVVYRARDTQLGRLVALKFLPPHLATHAEAKARLVREAKAASALDHPNIGYIHEIGETDEGQLFIAMAYYAGETLKVKIARGPLPVEEALDYAAQIAEGLARAHAAGIIHRDVKPANVVVTEEGTVKLVDFGLARAVGQSELPRIGRTSSAAADQSQLTRTGQALGTVVYMSPEQAKGKKVDARTDLWSLGAVLYEMLTGARPFKGASSQAVIDSILNEDFTPVEERRAYVPTALAAVTGRCLQKDPDARYPNAGALLDGLRAVGDPFLRDGSRPPVRRWLQDLRSKPARFAAGAMGLAVLLAVLVLPVGQPFSGAMERERSPEETRLAAAPEVDPRAFDVYLRGVEAITNEHRTPDWAQASQYFEASVAIDSNFAPAHARLAFWYASYSELPSDESVRKARRAVAAALRLDPTLPEAHLAQGMVRQYIDWDWAGAERAVRHAIDLDPSNSEAYHALAMLLMRQERFVEALAAERRAIYYSPLSGQYRSGLGEIYLNAGQPDRAIPEFERALDLEPDRDVVYWWMSAAYADKGAYEEALRAWEKSTEADRMPIRIYVAMGRREDVLEEIDAMVERWKRGDEPRLIYSIAGAYVALGENKKALDWLERSVNQSRFRLSLAYLRIRYDELQEEPRFQALLKNVGLDDESLRKAEAQRTGQVGTS